MKDKPIVGLALGSGAARGLAHFGVLKALKEYDFDIQFVAGASIGAVVGAAYAAGREQALEEAYRTMDRKKIFSLFDLVLPGSSILEGNKVSEFVQQHLGLDQFEGLHKKLGIITTDLLSGSEVVLMEGDLKQAIRASFAVPGIMKPVKMGEYMLLDGGMVNPVPVSTVKNMGADLVIAVDVNHYLLESNVAQLKANKKIESDVKEETNERSSIDSKKQSNVDSENSQDQKQTSQEQDSGESSNNNHGKSEQCEQANQENVEMAVTETQDAEAQGTETLVVSEKSVTEQQSDNQQNSWLNKLNNKISNIEMPALDKFKKWTDKEPMPGIFSVMMASVDIMERQIAKSQLKECPPDILIKPKVGDYKFLDFDHAEALIEAGYDAAKEAIEEYLDKKKAADDEEASRSFLSKIFN